MSSAHVATTRLLVIVFTGLGVLTAVTVLAASVNFHFPFLNTAIALTIAVTKGTLVVWFFMGVRYNTPLTKVIVVSGFLWLLILFGLGMSDYATRPWLQVPGR